MLAERREKPIRAIDESRATAKLTAIVGGDAPVVFVGRAAEIDRVRRGLVDAPLAIVLGLPGAGKRALARRVASAWPGPVARHAVQPGDDARSLLAALDRALGEPGEPPPSSVSDLCARIDRRGALAVIEDADRLAGPGAIELVDAIAARLRRGRLIATGRTRRREADEGPERVELVLGGLSPGDARDLWARLDQLHGARAGFDQAWQRTAGNPLHLRRAHRGDPDQDPLAPSIAGLDPAERRLAIALALAGRPLPRTIAIALAGDPSGDRATTGRRSSEAAVRGLVARLLVEVLPGGALTAPELARPGLCAAALADERAALHGSLGAIDDAELGAADGACFRAEHLLAAGRRRAARDLLVERAADLARAGATAALVRGLDRALDEPRGDDDRAARVVRARARTRRLELDHARRELARPAARGDAAHPGDDEHALQAGLDLAALRLDDAVRAARAGLAAPAVPAARRARMAAVQILAATLRGDGDAARVDAVDAPVLARAASLWLEGRDRDAARAIREVDAGGGDPAALGARLMVIARAVLDGEAARVDAVDAAVAGLDDPLLRAIAGGARALVDERRGDHPAARDRAAAAEDAFARGGHRLGALLCRLVRARALLSCGQVRAGRRLLDEVAGEAAAAGASLVVGLAGSARRADPWTAITGTAPVEDGGGSRRAGVLALVRAIGAGRAQVARGYLAAVDLAALDPLEAALVAAAGRALDGRDLDPAELDLACERAARAGADPELVPAVSAWLAERSAARSAGAIREVVIDRAADRIRIDAAVIDLARRPALRRLFYALLDAPGRSCDRTALARAIWSIDYRPSVHDGAIWVNVKRLRGLLAPLGLRIAACDQTVRLHVDDGRELRVV